MPSSDYKSIKLLLYSLLFLGTICTRVLCEIDYNTVNNDGSFSYRHSNDDIGGYYHSASSVGSPDNNIVRGRYGSRSPASGQVEEVVYTAGPRGFRANGPRIHRKMDLSQYPPGPIGTPDDPLADPYDDPSYSFSFRTGDQSRTEENDATGRVRGLYSYLDDVGERHTVRYAAGAGTGFEVSNAIPDNPVTVAYTAPLYKAHPRTRGRMTVQRGPNGSYKLIAAGPDHRRAESRAPDGFVKGTYSYLDDKGVQHTVQYVAGAGIGYRVVQNTIGPGTHNNPSVADFRLSDTDFRLTSEYGRGAGGGLGGGGLDGGGPSVDSGSSGSGSGWTGGSVGPSGSGVPSGSGGPSGSGVPSGSGASSGVGTDQIRYEAESRQEVDSRNNYRSDNRGGVRGGSSDRSSTTGIEGNRRASAAANRGGMRYGSGTTNYNSDRNGGPGGGFDHDHSSNRGTGPNLSDRGSSNRPIHNSNVDRNRNRGSTTYNRDGSLNSVDSGSYLYDPPKATTNNNYDLNDDDVAALPPLITANRKILEIERERDWREKQRDSTLIKNSGKWYIGLPPGQSVRAHVQNIDLLPLGSRHVMSPSEALRQDEIADMLAAVDRGEGRYRRKSKSLKDSDEKKKGETHKVGD